MTVLEGEGQHFHSVFPMQVVLGANMISKIGSFENKEEQRLFSRGCTFAVGSGCVRNRTRNSCQKVPQGGF